MKAKERILVVDDDPHLRKTLSDVLGAKGYEAVVAADGAEAIAAAERSEFSLALIDLVLPDMPGLDVMARIKAISPSTEAIILTGHASIDTSIEATGRGAFSYLLKPYQMNDLLLSIGHAVERRQAQQEILRLASFPRLHPSPVIELDPGGNVTYLNPAAEGLFPELTSMGQQHPLLRGLGELIAALRQGKQPGDEVHEAKVGEATYELHASYIREVGLIRIYVMDITERKRAEEGVHILAVTDSLTGIANRREFSAVLEREVERAQRYGTPTSLVMYDIDYFKRVNDAFGHDVGDYVLQTITGLVKEDVRVVDIVARWGGDEFLVLMPQSDMRAAASAAEKLRLEIGQYRFETAGKVTVSLGVTAFEPHDDSNSLLKRVDEALYRAKQLGRNRVQVLAGEATSE